MLKLTALVCSVSLLLGQGRDNQRNLPADLGMVPADATGFMHVRLGDLWKSEGFRFYRETVLKAGGEALAEFDRRFSPHPSSIDRLTAYLIQGEIKDEPEIVIILRTTKAIDRKLFLRQSMPKAQAEEIAGKTVYVDTREKAAVTFPDDQFMIFGTTESVRTVLTRKPARTGRLAKAIASADTKTFVIAFAPSALPVQAIKQARKEIPPPFHPLLRADLIVWAHDHAQADVIDVRVHYLNSEAAEDAERAAHFGLALARQKLEEPRENLRSRIFVDRATTIEDLPETAGALFGLGLLNRIDEFLKAPPLTRQGASLVVSAKLPAELANHATAAPVLIALLVPAVQKVREAAARTQDINNVKQMGVAMHNYHDVYRGFPSAAICDKQGKPLLSWRVAILPFLEQDELYRKFKLDEPWDSEHNKKLIPLMPSIYNLAREPLPLGQTQYRVLVGGGALFDLQKKTRLTGVTDGLSNTLLIVQTLDTVPWTKPEEAVYDPQKPLPRFGNHHGTGKFLAAFADGSVIMLRVDLPEQTLRALITRNGGEIVPKLE